MTAPLNRDREGAFLATLAACSPDQIAIADALGLRAEQVRDVEESDDGRTLIAELAWERLRLVASAFPHTGEFVEGAEGRKTLRIHIDAADLDLDGRRLHLVAYASAREPVTLRWEQGVSARERA